MCKAGFAGDDAPRAVFPSVRSISIFVFRRQDLQDEQDVKSSPPEFIGRVY
jgi:actin-related protein